jgi:hypothetical protein
MPVEDGALVSVQGAIVDNLGELLAFGLEDLKLVLLATAWAFVTAQYFMRLRVRQLAYLDLVPCVVGYPKAGAEVAL